MKVLNLYTHDSFRVVINNDKISSFYIDDLPQTDTAYNLVVTGEQGTYDFTIASRIVIEANKITFIYDGSMPKGKYNGVLTSTSKEDHLYMNLDIEFVLK